MAKREKKLVQKGITSEVMEQAFADYSQADAKLESISSKMDLEITKIREKYQSDIKEHTDLRTKAFDTLQAYALENREVLFSKKKSIETVHGLIGFRTGTPKLKTLKGFTWKASTKLIKAFLPTYVRTVEEPAKDKLLADRDNEKVSSLFSKVGIYVDQDETFFVEPKKEEITANI